MFGAILCKGYLLFNTKAHIQCSGVLALQELMEEAIERTSLPVDLQAGSGPTEAPHPLPVFGMDAVATVSTAQALSKDSA